MSGPFKLAPLPWEEDALAPVISANTIAFHYHKHHKAYVDNEVAYHKTVNGALSMTLIPDSKNPELKQLLETGLKLFEEHQHHAEMLAKDVH